MLLLFIGLGWTAHAAHRDFQSDVRMHSDKYAQARLDAAWSLLQTRSSLQSEFDWDDQAKLPPWMSPVQEGAAQGVALVMGQSLKPDGTPPQVLIDRAALAKTLVDDGLVVKVIVSGGDPAGVGTTEASQMAKVLQKAGVPADMIIQEAQATTTAENAWFALRWIPRGTGQFYIVTSDFHMPRATFIVQETFNYFYKMVEDAYRGDPRWTSETKRYPRLNITQITARSYCGTEASLNRDNDPTADINDKSLALRAMNEVTYLGDGEVVNSMYGEPLSHIQYIWPIQINVTKDPESSVNFRNAMAQVMNAGQQLCACKSPPEDVGPLITNPLSTPISTEFPAEKSAADWQEIIDVCNKTASLLLV